MTLNDKNDKSWIAPVKQKIEEISGNVKNTTLENVTAAKELSGTARHTISTFAKKGFEAVKNQIRPAFQIFEQADSKEGTILRKQISAARVNLNHQLYNAELKLSETKKEVEKQLIPVRSGLVVAGEYLCKANQFRRKHPEAVVVGLTTAIAVPSLLLRGKLVAARNSFLAFSVGLSSTYGVQSFENALADKKKK